MKWLDYFNTEEGMLLSMYGIEGESYNLVDGKPVFTDLVLKEAETPEIARSTYTMSEVPGLYDYTRNYQFYDKKIIDQCLIWNQTDDSYNMPSAITLTEEESNKNSTIMADDDTYMQEMASKFVTGEASIESEWDAYIKQLKEMGIEDAISIQQAAYDRYMAR
jgi:putative aldouronate transport system substrate-binding protein